jgi:putative hydrolase of the HAD superfamily
MTESRTAAPIDGADVSAVCLDLDDTLWAVGPVIRRAEQVLHTWLADSFPHAAAMYTVEEVRELRASVAADYPGKQHDLSMLRKATYARLGQKTGCPPDFAEQAFAIFQAARNQVELYEDVLPSLERLAQSGPLFALTNGNADVEVIGIARYFDDVFSAAELGAAKPDRMVFEAVCQRTGFPASQVLHAGDDPWHDVAAARNAGMSAVWINRDGRPWPDELDEPACLVSGLTELADMVQA